MSWRGKYIGWYRMTQEVLGELMPELTDQEVMENITNEDQLIVPRGYSHLPRNKAKSLPQLSIKLSDTGIELGILYSDQEQFGLLKNLFKESHKKDLEKLIKELRSLDPSYETILNSKGRNEKTKLKRKYVSSKLDTQLIERIIEASEKMRKGGRQIQNNQSVYIPPKTSTLYLTRITVPLTEKEYSEALISIRPLFIIVTGIKSQKELISEKLRKPRVKQNLYREFIEVLNEVRRRDMISAEQRREINQKWRDNEDEREELIEMLKELINPHS